MSTIKADNFVDLSREAAGTTPNTIGSEYIVEGTVKAWVNGTVAAALTDSFNITSGTDNGVGDYTYNLTAAMDAATFAVVAAPAAGVGAMRTISIDVTTSSSFGSRPVNITGSAAVDQAQGNIVSGNLA